MKHKIKLIVVEEKSPEYSETDKNRIAEAVGVSSVRYADLSQNPQSDVTFSWDKMLSLDGNTAPALMYGYARGRGIQRKVGITEPHVQELRICDESERDVLVHILKFPIVVEMVVESKKQIFCVIISLNVRTNLTDFTTKILFYMQRTKKFKDQDSLW